MKTTLLEQTKKAIPIGQLDGVSRRKSCHEYHDIGCKRAKELYNYHGQCIDCPLPLCLEDEKREYVIREEKALVKRRHSIRRMARDGVNAKEIATRLGICTDTVYNYLRKERELKGH